MNFNFPTDNLYKFIALIGLILLSYGLVSENKYTDLVYKKTTEINTVWREVRVLDFEHRNPKEEFTDSISELNKIKNDVYKMNLLHKEMESLISDNEKLIELEADLKDKNRTICIFGLIILLIGLSLWYIKTQKKLDRK